MAKICSSETNGSPKLSSFKQNSTIGRGRGVPSSMLNIFENEPAATFLTIISKGTISTLCTNCSRTFNRLIK